MWIITRPAEESNALVDKLRAAGLDVRALPLLQRMDLTWPRLSETLPDETRLFFITSQQAAGQLPKLEDAVAAVAPATSEALRQLGIPLTVTAPGGALALAREVVAWASGQVHGGVRRKLHVIYPTSLAGLESLEQTQAVELLSTVGRVERFGAYRVEAPGVLKAQLAAAPANVGWVFFSPSAVEAFAANHPPSPGKVCCFGESTLNAYRSIAPASWPQGELIDREGDLAAQLLRLGSPPRSP